VAVVPARRCVHYRHLVDVCAGRHTTQHLCVSSHDTPADLAALASVLCDESGALAPEAAALAADMCSQLRIFLAPYGLAVAQNGEAQHGAARAGQAPHDAVRTTGTTVLVRLSIYEDGVLYTDMCGWVIGDWQPSPEEFAMHLVQVRYHRP
jgi:hypothetical protein